MNAVEIFQEILQSTEDINTSKPQRFPEAANDGDYFRQGDVYVTFRENKPKNVEVLKEQNPQVAEGNTQGSRHILSDVGKVVLYGKTNKTVLDGPTIEVKEEVTLTHPEHGDCILPPGWYEVTFQRKFAEELARVRD